MAAANTDKLRKLSRKWVGQIGAGGVADDTTTTIPLSSTTNLATDTAVTLVIDRVDSSGTKTPTLEETIVGVVSGSNIINSVRGVEGTAQAHSAGAVVEVLVTADGYNDIINHLLVQHLQDGNHGDVCATSLHSIAGVTASTISASDITASRNLTSCDIVSSTVTANSVTARTTNANLELDGNGTGHIETKSGLKMDEQAYFDAEVDNGNSAAADTIDWTAGNKQKTTLTASAVTLTFTAPTGPANLLLKVVQDGTGSRTITWPATVKWPGGTAPTLTTAASSVDIVTFYYDGTSYHGQSSLAFAVPA